MKHYLSSVLASLLLGSASWAYDFSFTTAEGFTGQGVTLNGQNGWTSSTSTLVNTSTELLYMGGQFNNALYTGESFDTNNGAITMTSNFRFNFIGSANTDTLNVFNLYDTTDGKSGGNMARVYFRYVHASQNWRLRYARYDGWDGADGSMYSTNVFSMADIGMTPGSDNFSDELSLSWVFEKGVDANNWSSSISLTNVTTGTAIDLNYTDGTTHTKTNVIVSSQFHVEDSLETQITTGGSSDLQYAQIFDYGTSSAVPETSTYSLIFGSLMLGYVMIRHRKA
ncbi:MAG: Uncharacterised protein [Opitutia bacterium UBA7350]|nr:MAG: Uncharacterised protein [Opitutae bacterium UBA7350]